METKAYTQVYSILQMLSEENKNKIPAELIEGIQREMDKDYEFEIDADTEDELELLDDTEKILSVIYTDYLATDEEQKVIQNKERKYMLEEEKEKKEKYPTDVFEARREKKDIEEAGIAEDLSEQMAVEDATEISDVQIEEDGGVEPLWTEKKEPDWRETPFKKIELEENINKLPDAVYKTIEENQYEEVSSPSYMARRNRLLDEYNIGGQVVQWEDAVSDSNELMIIPEEKWYHKLFDFFKKIFGK